MTRDDITLWISKLPPLPESIQKLERLFASSTSPEVSQIVSIIESDPALSADILAFSNSPLYGFSKQLQSIQQAVTLFGIHQIRKMALKSALFGNFDVDMSAYGISNDMFLKITSFQSDLVFQWYMSVDIDKSRTLLPIAFVMEAGSLVISRYIIDNGLQEQFLNDLQRLDVQEAEILHTRMSTLQINYILFEHWKLNDIYIKTMHTLDNELYKSDPYIEELANALKAVRTVVNLKNQFRKEDIKTAKLFLEDKGISGDKFEKVCYRLAKKFQES